MSTTAAAGGAELVLVSAGTRTVGLGDGLEVRHRLGQRRADLERLAQLVAEASQDASVVAERRSATSRAAANLAADSRMTAALWRRLLLSDGPVEDVRSCVAVSRLLEAARDALGSVATPAGVATSRRFVGAGLVVLDDLEHPGASTSLAGTGEPGSYSTPSAPAWLSGGGCRAGGPAHQADSGRDAAGVVVCGVRGYPAWCGGR